MDEIFILSNVKINVKLHVPKATIKLSYKIPDMYRIHLADFGKREISSLKQERI